MDLGSHPGWIHTLDRYARTPESCYRSGYTDVACGHTASHATRDVALVGSCEAALA